MKKWRVFRLSALLNHIPHLTLMNVFGQHVQTRRAQLELWIFISNDDVNIADGSSDCLIQDYYIRCRVWNPVELSLGIDCVVVAHFFCLLGREVAARLCEVPRTPSQYKHDQHHGIYFESALLMKMIKEPQSKSCAQIYG